MCKIPKGFSVNIKTVLSLLLLCSTSAHLSQQTAITATPEKNSAARVTEALAASANVKENKNLDITGSFKSDYTREHYQTYLNKELPEEYGYFKSRFDLGFKFAHDDAAYDTSVIKLVADLRHNSIAGFWSANEGTLTSTTGIDADTTSGSHSHGINKPLLGIRNLYGEYLLNHALGLNIDTNHTIKVGMFEFSLGRGISYGASYGLSKSFLGVFSEATNYSPFGMLISGDVIKGKMSYDLYWSRLEELSAKPNQVFGTEAARTGDGSTKINGTDKSNDVYAARLKYKYDFEKYGKLETEGYLLYNDAQDQKAEIARDASVRLVTGGLGLEYKNKNFELGVEGAMNRGEELMKQIDRNTKVLKHDSDGYGQFYYTKVLDGEDSATVGISDAIDAKLKTNRDNGYLVQTGVYNASDRIRQSFTNNLKGWMLVADGSYRFDSYNMTIASAAGYASGDVNPHSVEKDKNYKGFIGINENYAGTRVTSALTLNARKALRPVLSSSLDDSSNVDAKPLIDNSFSNIIFAGAGLKWKCNSCRTEIALNGLSYWNDVSTNAWDANQSQALARLANSYLGFEVNTIVKYSLTEHLKFEATGALFVPGAFYTDIKGMNLSGQVMGNNIAPYFSAGMNYSF